MMEKLIRAFIRYPLAGDLLMVLVLVGGWMGLTHLRSSFFPEVPSKTILIQLVYPGASPEEMEEGIVAKIEENLEGIAGLDQVRSQCSENTATITIEVMDAAMTDEILQNVKNAVDRIASFPVGMEPPIVFKRDAIAVAFSFAVTGIDDLSALKAEARRIEQELLASEEISQIELSGFPAEEIEIRIREEKLNALQISMAEVALAVRNANIETTGGRLKTPEEELIVRGKFRVYDADGLEEIVIRADRDGRVVRLGDIAEVSDQWAENDPSRNWFNGKPAAVVTVNNLNSESILEITEYVRRYIEAYNSQGKPTQLQVIRDASVVLNQRIDILVSNGIQGFFLVILFLALFLNLRLAFWVALSIPVSFAAMFMVADLMGITINVISLFGMIVVVGILVDDGIVIAENVYQHYERGATRLRAAVDGTLEVLPSVLSAVLTTVVAFCSFFFIEGRLGETFGDMAKVIIFTLVFSLIEGALILPAHIAHSKALRPDAQPNRLERISKRGLEWLRDGLYAPVLRKVMRYPWITFSLMVTLFMISVPGLIGGGHVKTTFFPFIEGDNININLTMQAGTRASLTLEQLDRIEQAVWEVNTALSAERTDGQQVILAVDKRVGPGTQNGIINVQLLNGEERNYPSNDISAQIRERVGPVFGAENLSFSGFSPFGKPVSVSLLGTDLKALEEATEALKSGLSQRQDVKDITDNSQAGPQEVTLSIKPRARALGLSEQEILNQIRQAYFGTEVQRLQRGRDEVRVWVRVDERDRASLGALEGFRIRTPDGSRVPLAEVADYSLARGVSAINRFYGKREVQVNADIAGPWVSAAEVNADIKSKLMPEILARYPQIQVSYEGQNREQVKSQTSIQRIAPIIFGLMFFIIVLTFRSPLQGMAVFLLIPFGLVGVSLGHWIMGAQISLFSMLGMLALVGILVNDALVLVAAYNSNLREGMDLRKALYEACLSRFRPILLTSLTTVAGLAPLMLNKSFQAQFLIPMAISLAYGLAFVTLITLILLPVLLLWVNPLHRVWVWITTGKWPQVEAGEPTLRELREMNELEHHG